MILCKSFQEYLSILRKQYKLYGKIESKPFADYRCLDFRLGFSTPDGWWTVKLKTIKLHFEKETFEEQPGPIPGTKCFSRIPANDELILLVAAEVRKATKLD